MKTLLGTRGGMSLVELVVVLVILGIMASLAVPEVRQWTRSVRARSALNQLTGEIYRARAIAVADGRGARLVLHADAAGCIERLTIGRGYDSTAPSVSTRLDLLGHCMRHSGDSILSFNSRGMVKPPTRSFYVAYGSAADSVLLSIAGRARRSYRRRRLNYLPQAAINSGFRPRLRGIKRHIC